VTDPRNFDEFYNGQRAFILGGQTLHWRPLHWREWGKINDKRIADAIAEEAEHKKKLDKLVKSGKTELEAEEIIETEETVEENFEKLVERCMIYLEQEDIKVFRTVVDDPEKRISIAQLRALHEWLEEAQHPDRPTVVPSGSSSGPGSTGATSPAA
jgi:hypothetical protein